jgi:3-phenylpropionate/cinnamic acid dioxygenase small subunit
VSSSLYRTDEAQVTPELRSVRDRYDALANDVVTVRHAGAPDAGLTVAIAPLLHTEARRLDAEQWQDWVAWCCEETILWVPLNTRTPHPGDDQSLFLDDRRRIDERIWRFLDPNAWGVVPTGEVVRAVSSVEAWTAPDTPDEALVSSTIHLQHVRRGRVLRTLGRQVHRLRRGQDGMWMLLQKTLLLPELAAGTPHFGWLI